MQIFGLVAFIEQNENDNNDNLCKIHGGLYIASALNLSLLSLSFCSIKWWISFSSSRNRTEEPECIGVAMSVLLQTVSNRSTDLMEVVLWCVAPYYILVKVHGYNDGSNLPGSDSKTTCPPIDAAKWRHISTWQRQAAYSSSNQCLPTRNNIQVLPWPSKSPDFNPIEHLWDELDRRVRQRLWTSLGRARQARPPATAATTNTAATIPGASSWMQ